METIVGFLKEIFIGLVWQRIKAIFKCDQAKIRMREEIREFSQGQLVKETKKEIEAPARGASFVDGIHQQILALPESKALEQLIEKKVTDLVNRGEVKQAEAEMEKVAKDTALGRALASVVRGDAKFHAQDFSGAEQDYRQAVQAAEESGSSQLKAACLNGLAAALGMQYLHERALEAAVQAVTLDPQLARAWHNKGVVLGKLGKTKEAIECYNRALEINTKDAGAWHGKGVALGKLGRTQEAIECFDKVLEINPKYADAWHNKGLALVKLGKAEEAIECYNRALEINPRDAGTWHGKGVALDELGKTEEAIECFDKALEINPNYAEVLCYKGIALGKLGKTEEAVKCYEEALEINPKDAEALNNKGVALCQLNKTEEAVECFNRALEINPEDDVAWSNKGGALVNLGRTEEAIKCSDKALEINSKSAGAWYNKGVALMKLTRFDESSDSFQQAFDLREGLPDKGVLTYRAWLDLLLTQGLLRTIEQNREKAREQAESLARLKRIGSEEGLGMLFTDVLDAFRKDHPQASRELKKFMILVKKFENSLGG